MFETPFTVVGTIVTDLRRRRRRPGGLIKFRVASNSRRRTGDGTWEPGNSLFITVNCWGSKLVTGRRRRARARAHRSSSSVTSTPASTRTAKASGVRRWRCGPPRSDRTCRAASRRIDRPKQTGGSGGEAVETKDDESEDEDGAESAESETTLGEKVLPCRLSRPSADGAVGTASVHA